MSLADSHIWLALALYKLPFHGVARHWLGQQSARNAALFCRSTQQTFLRLLTTRAGLAPYGIPPLSTKAAWSAYEGFRTDERIDWADEPSGLDSRWKTFAGGSKASPKLWMDPYLAAFAISG